MKLYKIIKPLIFIALTSAFFIVPWVFESTRDYAPGIAVFSGIIFAVFIGNPFQKYTGKITSHLLGAAIVAMGCGMNLIEVLKAGANGIIYTVVGITLGISLGVFIGKKLKLSKNSIYLLSVGTSICGGSAIAAAAPVLKAKPHDIALASATVFTLNAVALLIFPEIGHALGFTQEQFGYWAALGIHDTSSVVGASMTYGETALAVGTTVKLARSLWIVPVTIYLSCFVADKEEGEKNKIRIRIPWFIPGFLIAAAIVTWVPQYLPQSADFIRCSGGMIKNISKYMMITTLFLIGANLSKDKLKELGIRPVIHGIILWLILASIWCVAIFHNLVNCTI